MAPMKLVPLFVVALLFTFLGWLFLHKPPAPGKTPSPPAPAAKPHEPACSRTVEEPIRSVTPLPPERTRWAMIGAAQAPSQNPVSIEQDAELLGRVLGPEGVFLLGGGPGARDVQVASPRSRRDTLLDELAELFAPRGGRDSRYRRSKLPVSAAASAGEVERILRGLLGAGRDPLLLYIAGHGEQGETPAGSSVSLWTGPRLTVEELATLLDASTRPVQLVVTSCYGGAFAEIAFRGADPRRGAAVDRCGFFATTYDLASTGCDPNPTRELQDSYALHLLNALASQDRVGKPIALSSIDFDGDGRVSLAEAHALARIDLDSIDVPTSTSERFLRQTASSTGGVGAAAPALPEERAVAHALAKRTGLAEHLAAARRDLSERERVIARARERLEAISDEEDQRAREVIGELLARWPILDDPWHPDFAELVRCQRRAIQEHLRGSKAYAAYEEARDEALDADDRHWDLRRRASPVERLARALETIELAGRLRGKGGADWERYARILACERTVPRK
jgi:hypothetical protein